MARPIVYSAWSSSSSWRVRAGLSIKKINYEVKPVTNMTPDEFEEYKKINPMGQVPAVRADGITLIDSFNILLYMDKTRPENPLLPKGTYEQARVRELCLLISCGIQPLSNMAVVEYLPKEAQADWPVHWINRGFTALEKLLSFTAGKYCFGDNLTIADCYLVPQVWKARDFKVDMSKYPIIDRIDKALNKLQPIIESNPQHQPDYPDHLKN